MGITVEQLLQLPFYDHSVEEKILIALEGKPRPLFQLSSTVGSDAEQNVIVQTHLFEPEIYDSVPWLTGCESQLCFYCWPCLLFPTSDSNWRASDPAFLSASISQHEKTAEHIQATLSLKMFSMQYFVEKKETMDDEQFNRIVDRNRRIVKLLIDAVSGAVIASQPPPEQYACQSQIELESCVKALKLLKCCSIKYNSEIDDSINVIKTTPSLLNDLVSSITNVLKIGIKKDIQNSTYASLILSDHSMGRTKSQISAIVRYTKKGKVHESFLGLINVFVRKSAIAIYTLISNLVDKFGLADKLLSYSFDGGVLEPSELHDLLSMMEKFHPRSFFVPCYFHGLCYILQQSLSCCKELKEFFRILSVMENYVNQSTIQCEIMSMPSKFPSFGRSTLSSDAPFLKVVRSCRKNFIKCLDSIVNNRCGLWSGDDYIKARTLLTFLQEFQTVFLFHCLAPLYDHIMYLEEDLRSSSPELAFRCETVSVITLKLLAEERSFEKHFYTAVQEMNRTNVDQKESTFLLQDIAKKEFCRKLHCSIIEHLVREITLRLKNLDKLKFCSVINKHSCNTQKIAALMNCYPQILEAIEPNFCEERFRNEMECQRKSGKILCENTAYELLSSFEDENLKSALKCTHKLLEFALTLPFSSLLPDEDSSKFQNIKRICFSPDSMDSSGNVSVLYIESDMLQDIRTNFFFHDEVIEKLYDLNKSIELMYRR